MTLSDPEINTKKKNKYFNWFQLKTSSKLSDLFQSYASELISFFLSMPAFFLHRETEMKPHFWPFLPLLRDSFFVESFQPRRHEFEVTKRNGNSAKKMSDLLLKHLCPQQGLNFQECHIFDTWVLLLPNWAARLFPRLNIQCHNHLESTCLPFLISSIESGIGINSSP